MFRRVMCRAELSGWVDPWCYSYRKEFSPHYLAIFVRWALAYWVLVYSRVWVADWDESSAFCNVCRDDMAGLLEGTSFPIGDWVKGFFDTLQIFVSTPFGLTDPYTMKQGGVQGDSLGVLQYLLVRLARSKALRHRVGGPLHPCLPHVWVPEVLFSDDSRLFALSAEGLGGILDMSADLAFRAGASVNIDKLQVFHITLGESGLVYSPGRVPSTMGELVGQLSGLRMVGIPCVMGEPPREDVSKLLSALLVCLSRVRRHRPSCILALRVVLTFSVASADFKFCVVPVSPSALSPAQTLVHQIARSALQVPNWFPSHWLTVPVSHGGVGFPHLHSRLSLRRVLMALQACTCRSIFTSSMIRALLHSALWHAAPWSDASALLTTMADHHLRLSTCPESDVSELPLWGSWFRQPSDAPVIAVSDGSCAGQCVGYSVVFYNEHGFVGGILWGHAAGRPLQLGCRVVGQSLGGRVSLSIFARGCPVPG